MDISTFDVALYDSILDRGLSSGLGSREGSMCIEAAICTVLGLEHSDDPKCVAKSVRSFKICLNDKKWSSKKARATGLRDLGLAQLGSLSVVNDVEFVKRLAEKLIRVMIPTLLRSKYSDNSEIMAAADRCEAEGSKESLYAARDILRQRATYAAYADAAGAAAYAAAAAADAGAAAYAAAAAADAYAAARAARDAAAAARADADAYAAYAAAREKQNTKLEEMLAKLESAAATGAGDDTTQEDNRD